MNGKPKKSKKITALAQDIKLSRVLAGNNKKLRDRALKSLKRWLKIRSQSMPFTEDGFMRVWKGLFYSMWMSDKPLVQEECAENIAQLVHLSTVEESLLFFKCGLRTLGDEWFGIDYLRLDKFLMFVRRFLRQGLTILSNNSWDVKVIKQYNNILSETVLNAESPPQFGLTMHFIEIYLEEVSKVSNGDLRHHLLTEMLRPFIKYLALLRDSRQINCIRNFIFGYLLKQSDAGIEYEEKFKAWRKEGFPGGSIDAMQKLEMSDEGEISDDEETQCDEVVLDPRAGHVDVVLPQLKFSSKQIVDILKQYQSVDGSNVKSRKAIGLLINAFGNMSKGIYPLGVKKVELPRDDGYSMKLKNAVNRLVKFEKKILNKDKKRKRKTDDVVLKKIKRTDTVNTLRQLRESCEIEKKKKKEKNGQTDKKLAGEVCEDNSGYEFRKRKTDDVVSEKIKTTDIVNPFLRRFIENCESDDKEIVKKKKKEKNRQTDKKLAEEVCEENSDYEFFFKRNSGTWFVYNGEDSPQNLSLDQSSTMSNENVPIKRKLKKIPNVSRNLHLKANLSKEKNCVEQITPDSTVSGINFSVNESRLEKSKNDRTLSPILKQSSPKLPADVKTSTPKTENFTQNEWNVPLKDGELEFFVPSNKGVKRSIPQNTNKTKSLSVSDSKLVKNPFAKKLKSPGGSLKKVKIDLKLNRSQEIHEHIARIKSSPGIPFDANKRPSKPLLKPSIAGPINPFYKRKLKL